MTTPKRSRLSVRQSYRDSTYRDTTRWVLPSSGWYSTRGTVVSSTPWGVGGARLLNLPGVLWTWLVVALPPPSPPGLPAFGGVTVTELDCQVFDGTTLTPAGSTGSIAGSVLTPSAQPTAGVSNVTGSLTTIIPAATVQTCILGIVTGVTTLPPVTLTGVQATIPWPAWPTYTGSAVVTTTQAPVAPTIAGITLCAYKQAWDGVFHRFQAQQPYDTDLFPVMADLLVLQRDVYQQPSEISSYSGREWRLRLPNPVRLCVGEALLVTIGLDPLCNAAPVTVVPFIRAAISDAD